MAYRKICSYYNLCLNIGTSNKQKIKQFLFNKQPDASIIQIYSIINSTCFGHLLCPSSGVFYCTFGTGKFHASLMTVSKQREDVPSSRCLETIIKPA